MTRRFLDCPRRRSFAGRVLAIVLAAGLSAQCGSTPVAPPPPGLFVTCPGNVTVQSPEGDPVTVVFDPPRATGGVAPVTASCSAQPGSSFQVGSATVACQAQDGRGQVATCNFIVLVQPPPRLVGTRFLAFGDSLTAGVVSQSVSLLIVSSPTAYPALLQAGLTSRYRSQSPVVINDGIGGEKASVDGIRRFRSVMLHHRPDIVLLMEGTNDLLDWEPGAEAAILALRLMVQEAKSLGALVGLATVPPQRAGGARQRDNVVRLIPGFNESIRALAADEDVLLIDVYEGMKDDLTLIGVDDLHPTERGYQVMADIFFEAIKGGFEEPVPTLDLTRGSWR